jgi:hypothetical protein
LIMSQAKLEAKLDALAVMSPAQLQADWNELSGEELPNIPASLTRHLIAYRLQEKQHGKLPIQIERQLDRMTRERRQGSQRDGFDERAAYASVELREPIPLGTRFLREWNGKTIAVTKVEGGFDWEGGVYRSLSEIARKVTGAHWSGPRFFGLTKGSG